ncbi:MAG: hypothetical protein HUU21_21865 [Polyangiaceae bacterium]|nr:hypothetical protein [Polyangiaceae bacterium]NUQ76195.1 hypothetical protein [Polyangiaceae bacterium]
MSSADYSKFTKVFEGTHAVLYDCSPSVPHLAIGVWRGYFELSSKVFIDEMWRSIDFIKDRKIVAIISDHTDLKVVGNDVLEWLHANWYPNAAKHGLRIEAALDAKSAVASLSLRRMLVEAKTGKVSTPLFPTFDAAFNFCREFIKKYETDR